jgi:HKD family nuclease
MIERRNILELIGKHRGKYHSCVLTCYSLDFSFFEERLLPTLRLANIKNVNILADGHYLEMAHEATTGKEFKHNKTYNFQPVYETGVFHPKIMLLTGVKHGLLIIGSGNITSSGLSTNDEIWGAFHLDNVGNENAPLFGVVWKYLQPYLDKSLGFVPQKIEWIRKHSPWLMELPVTEDWINFESIGLQLKFIGNNDQESTFNQLTSNVPNKEVEELTIISPYYDKSGKQLKQLLEHFKPKKMKCLVDSNSGLLPTELDGASSTRISFYNWAECKEDYEEIYHRLHAKLINFRTKDEEYLLLGSANVTMAAMGTRNGKTANGEAGILLNRRISEKSWLEELKVKIPNSTIELQAISHQGIGDGSIPRVNYGYRILYAELRGNEITIYLNKHCTDPVDIIVLDRSNLKLESTLKGNSEDTIIIEVLDPENIFKLYLNDETQERISNYCLIHRLEALLRCNPDPKQEKLDTLMEQDFADDEGITDLLNFVDYNWADDEDLAIKKVHNGTSILRKVGNAEQTREYELFKAEEFNKVSTESLLKQSGELSNSTVKIAEFLNLYSSGVFGKEDDFQESEEQKLFEDEKQEGDGDDSENKLRRRTQGSKEKVALIKYFKKLDDIYAKRLNKLLTTKVLNEAPQTLITIRSLSSVLIALHLIQIKYGKKFTVITKELDQAGNAITTEETFIPSGTISESVSSIKGFLFNVLGKFLLLSGAGYNQYEYDILNKKLARSQMQLVVKSTCLILNTPWRESEGIGRDVLLLNCLYFSLGIRILNDEVASDFINKLNHYKTNSTFVIPQFQDQLKNFTKEILPSYLDWLKVYMNKDERLRKHLCHTSELEHGNIIFNSKVGFNVIKKVTSDDWNCKLHLSRAGYPFTEGEFLLKNVQFGIKCIKYEYKMPEIINLS